MLRTIKDKNDRILIELQEKVSRWEEHFKELLNSDMSEKPVPEWKEQRAELELKVITLNMTTKAIKQLKTWKATGQDGTPTKLIKLGGMKLCEAIHELCEHLWNKQKLLDEWYSHSNISL